MYRIVSGACHGYLLLTLVVWLVLWATTDRWWAASLLAYGPRWLLLTPLAALIPLVLFVGSPTRSRFHPCKGLVSLGVSAAILLIPVMGLQFRVFRPVRDAEAPRVRILTCNVDGQAAQFQAFGQLIRNRLPQIVALQECAEIATERWPKDWNVASRGQLVLASPFPIRDVQSLQRQIPVTRWPPVHALRCVVDLPQGPVTVCCVHLRTPRFALERILNRRTIIEPSQAPAMRLETIYRQLETEVILEWLANVEGPLLVVGDLNTPPESQILEDWQKKNFDAFREVGRGYGQTKITEFGPLRFGTRIDYILCGPGMRPIRCWVEGDIGSDHFPLLADVQWTRPQDSPP